MPTINQIELHPLPPAGRAARLARRARDRDRGLEPARPGRGARATRRSMTIAAHHERTAAQVILRWHLQLGNVVIPKSVDPGADPRELRDLRLRAQPRTTWRRSPASTPASAPAPTRRLSRAAVRAGTRSRAAAFLRRRLAVRDRRRAGPGRHRRPAPRRGRLPGRRRLLLHRRLRRRAAGDQRRRTGAATAAARARPGAGGRASRADSTTSRGVVLFVGTLVFAVNLVDSLLGELTPTQVRPPGLVPDIVGCLLFLDLRPPRDGRHLRRLVPRRCRARGPRLVDRRSSTSSARSSSWSPRSPPSSAPTAT